MEVNNITLNFLDKYYMFYDWLKDDNIKIYNKILLIKVKSKILYDLKNNYIKIENKNYNNKNVIFTDGFSYLAIRFDKEGYSKLKSSILLNDEEKLGKKIHLLNENKLKYNIISQDKYTLEPRINIYIKKVINEKINELFLNNDIDKIKYFYYEWFEKETDDLELIRKKITKCLSKKLTSKEKQIYDLLESIKY